MKIEHLFPIVLIALDIGAAFVYLSAGNLRLTIYWTAAAVLTASITF